MLECVRLQDKSDCKQMKEGNHLLSGLSFLSAVMSKRSAVREESVLLQIYFQKPANTHTHCLEPDEFPT